MDIETIRTYCLEKIDHSYEEVIKKFTRKQKEAYHELP